MRTPLLLIILAALSARAQDDGLIQTLDPDAPRGVAALPRDVSTIEEDPLLAPGRRPALLPIEPVDGRREPLIVVHGIQADFGDVAELVRRVSLEGTYQPYVLAYADWKRRTSLNGDDLAALVHERLRGRRVTFVGHSMGGIVVRRALNRLAVEEKLGDFPALRLFSVDTPWHGYDGPPDGARMSFVRPFMADGLEDMRARSPMFHGDRRSADVLDRLGLFGLDLPAHVSIRMVVAEREDAALDYTELPSVPAEAARLVNGEALSTDVDPQTRHFVLALRASEAWPALARLAPTTEACVREALLELVPRLPGGHSTTLLTESFFLKLGEWLGVDLTF
jgi:pimeloyl-ACP methyl ester carboxylesterase